MGEYKMGKTRQVLVDNVIGSRTINEAVGFGDLPPADTRRWVVRRKAEVIAAINSGRLTRAEACTRYRLSEEELCLWERAIGAAGIPGLRVTRVQVYRPVFEALD